MAKIHSQTRSFKCLHFTYEYLMTLCAQSLPPSLKYPFILQLHAYTHPTHQSVLVQHIYYYLQSKTAFIEKSRSQEQQIHCRHTHTDRDTHIIVSHFYSISEVEVWKWIARVTAIAEDSLSCGHYWLCRYCHATLILVKL